MTPKKRKLLWIAVAAVVLLCSAPFAWNAWTQHALDAAKARCRAAGLPMTVEEIRPPPIPDADNAAPLLEKIGALMKAETFAGSDSEPGVLGKIFDFKQAHPDRRLDAAATNELAKTLDRPDVEAILALVREAAGRRGIDTHLDYGKGAALQFPFIGTVLDSIKLLAAHAWLAAIRQQPEAACTDLWAMFGLAEFPAREPMIITQLTRIAGEGLTIEALEKTASAGCLTPNWAEKFDAHLRSLELTKDFVRSMDGERVAFGGWIFENVISGKFNPRLLTGDSSGKMRFFWRYTLGRLCRFEYAFYLDRMQIVRSEVENTAQGEPAQNAHLKNNTDATPRYHFLTALVLPSLAGANRKVWQARAAIEVAIAGVALERYQVRHGHYPETPMALVPEFLKDAPRDLFTDKPLVYRHWNRGAVIYSVGPNRRDDAGVFDFIADKDDRAWHAGIPEQVTATRP